jgi:hypothetical protein
MFDDPFCQSVSRTGFVVSILALGMEQRRTQRGLPSRSSTVIIAAYQLPQRLEVPDLNVTPPYANKSLLVEFGKDSTYGLQLEP